MSQIAKHEASSSCCTPLLLALVNLVAEQTISHPREIDSLYEKLPAGKREAIERRDMAKPAK
ncbi:hypothetical protein [Burkholderia cenocepacia]|uniref:hypothetical protein n=1 Tax=Burkholderia cenocepacia TaxID=95486 RepID=UPI002AB7403C|nr:hypothetical protein [Burkholderia cenocepacia]